MCSGESTLAHQVVLYRDVPPLHGKGADLHHHREVVAHHPTFDELAILDPVDMHVLDGKVFA